MSQTEQKQDPHYIGRIPGMWRWGTDYETMAEWAGGEENVSIMFTHQYVVNLAEDDEVIQKQYACLNREYDCGHLAYGPPRMLPDECPECSPK